MSTIRIALLAASLLTAVATAQAQTTQPSGSTPSTTPRTAPDADKAESPPGKAAVGVEGSTGTQSGPGPDAAKNSSGPMPHGRAVPQSATDPATGRDVDRSIATPGIPAGQGAQGGPMPDKAKEK